MCLQMVFKEKPEPTGMGYKGFGVSAGSLYGEIQGRKKKRPTGKWIHADDFRDKRYKVDFGYFPYWHIFEYKRDAIGWMRWSDHNYTVKKVKYRGATVKGTQGACRKIIVAKEIFIIPDTKTED